MLGLRWDITAKSHLGSFTLTVSFLACVNFNHIFLTDFPLSSHTTAVSNSLWLPRLQYLSVFIL